jgi:hypothetical protein
MTKVVGSTGLCHRSRKMLGKDCNDLSSSGSRWRRRNEQWVNSIGLKTGRFDIQDLRGLLEFSPLLPSLHAARDYRPRRRRGCTGNGVQSISWVDFLLAGPPQSSIAQRRFHGVTLTLFKALPACSFASVPMPGEF